MGAINPSAGFIDCSGDAHPCSKAKSKMFQLDETHQGRQEAGKGMLAEGMGWVCVAVGHQRTTQHSVLVRKKKEEEESLFGF